MWLLGSYWVSHLSLDAPSSTSVALALSHAVLPKRIFLEEDALSGSWPTTGLPETIHLDNAKEFHSHALKRGCREHGISLTFRPPQTPHFGGHIERLIGTMMGELHLLPGTTFSSTKERGEYKSARLASLTMRELDRWLTLQIVEVYNQRVHRAIGVPPITAWGVVLLIIWHIIVRIIWHTIVSGALADQSDAETFCRNWHSVYFSPPIQGRCAK
jgi:putative transposase